MAITVPAVGDSATAAWADSVANAINNLLLADSGFNSTASAAFTTAGTAVASPASATFTLAVQQRVRIDSIAQYQMASGTNGRYYNRPAYNSGASVVLGSAIGVGFFATCLIPSVVGVNGMVTAQSFATVLLAAGTYTAYALLARTVGGSATDFCQSSQVLVTGLGFS